MPGESDKWGWKHVSVYGGFDKGSGTKRWKCNHCNVRYNGSYSRVRAHLLGFTGVGVKGCPAIDRSLREAFQALEEDRVTRKKKKPTTASGKPPGKRVKTLQLNSTAALRTLSKEDVDDAVSRFFYADSLNLNTINSYYFQDMAKALASFGPGYELPSREQLAGPSLNKEKARIERSFNLVKESWPHTGCTILCVNRLDSSLGCFCINFFISSPRGVMFLKTIDINEGDGADSLFISVLSDTIIEAGPTNVLQVITHLGQASSAFESIIMTKFPNVFWSHCTSHSIYVLMEEIAEIEWMKTTISCARGIEQIVLSYQRTSSSIIFDNQKDCSIHHHIGLKFAPCYLLVQKMFDIQQKLRELVGSEEWKQWKLTVPTDDCITTIEAALLGDEFWNKVELMIQLYEPFITSLSALDIDKSVMGDIYNWRAQSLETLRCKGIDHTSVNELEMVIETKWDMLFSPLHAAGYMLNPRYFGKGQTKDKNVMRGWKGTLDRYESDSGARRTLREQLSFFWRMEGSLGEEDAVECRDKMDPVAWWENFGFEIPQLQTLAIRVLSQVCSVSICQDGWKCNTLPCKQSVCKLGVEKTEDLVFVQNNLRLQSQKSGNPSCLFGSRNGTTSCGSIIAT